MICFVASWGGCVFGVGWGEGRTCVACVVLTPRHARPAKATALIPVQSDALRVLASPLLEAARVERAETTVDLVPTAGALGDVMGRALDRPRPEASRRGRTGTVVLRWSPRQHRSTKSLRHLN